ncbi:hypothetical protein GG344DRAFT_83887 [Lentinula edodes]|nr:hypothetical protein GG344DRAFT_83887 [Lentinula edodes]
MVVDISSDRGYNGLLNAVSTDHQSNPADILDDLEESYDTANLDISSDQSSNDLSGLNDAVREISKGVLEKTAQEYLRLLISSSCDTINLDGSSIPASVEKSTYTHAQKMRAAATFGFGRIYGLGMQAWHSSEITGKMLGNPSVSEITQSGDTPTSARAVTSVLLESLYYYNKQPEFQKPKAYQSTSRSGLKGQLGAYSRTLLILGYVIAFCALLRIDELLKIQLQDMATSKDPKSGRGMLTLRLPFRKTSQFGGKVE